MKKYFLLAAIAVSFLACNDQERIHLQSKLTRGDIANLVSKYGLELTFNDPVINAEHLNSEDFEKFLLNINKNKESELVIMDNSLIALRVTDEQKKIICDDAWIVGTPLWFNLCLQEGASGSGPIEIWSEVTGITAFTEWHQLNWSYSINADGTWDITINGVWHYNLVVDGFGTIIKDFTTYKAVYDPATKSWKKISLHR